ncbi:hypothetical protein COW36_17175 [bacterium (Candidatus Blackallbacteria) CG17_big_fil_post_rev_8_21_14_2_50_48_46]|uniref:Permuted papain-like amidase YaeF/Yiix C92 family enzyme n=1 Tax=bacterium (Candidatus Blackallbacteria) CG17_big_fil_post_rev_8_21_14_2_50_48_46 TaxID=2014261 RepID=A0A2M7G0V2_9BACT|nr:MAG: hypothetical protein COW64_01555 [bacterium (Candidatus Blackallbacteria) CG18_big_fil_WC_8_21_14_2_50_49_26]PIW15157.1 MAG: hypothetical protein COW36_17175 [bacterium (Candidatus Blackallbacteria) CG17_big_fil_post_rev_8_21_14_2_50_48_46]PIW50167.1 MAG: hypothetical protein COW20_03595 [bacterium (Candidatus Blackallbacteria) CG13_big_fil_rev_8_21_14_2_50_49_14]
MKKIFALAFTALSLTACSATPSLLPVASGFQPPALRAAAAAPRQNLNELLPLLKQIFKNELADGLQAGQPSPDINQILEQKGPEAFKLLAVDASARKALYPYADQMVINEFNKPSPSDNVPPLSAQELQALLPRLQSGDVILCGNDQSFVHGILYLGRGEIVHSLATQPDMHDRFRGVVKESLATYIARSPRDTFVILRAKGQSAANFTPALNFAIKQVGKQYDSLFLYQTDERFYCTELVWSALRQIARPPRVMPHLVKYGWEMVTVEDFMDSPDLETVWTRNYTRPPVGRMHRY